MARQTKGECKKIQDNVFEVDSYHRSYYIFLKCFVHWTAIVVP